MDYNDLLKIEDNELHSTENDKPSTVSGFIRFEYLF